MGQYSSMQYSSLVRYPRKLFFSFICGYENHSCLTCGPLFYILSFTYLPTWLCRYLLVLAHFYMFFIFFLSTFVSEFQIFSPSSYVLRNFTFSVTAAPLLISSRSRTRVTVSTEILSHLKWGDQKTEINSRFLLAKNKKAMFVIIQ